MWPSTPVSTPSPTYGGRCQTLRYSLKMMLMTKPAAVCIRIWQPVHIADVQRHLAMMPSAQVTAHAVSHQTAAARELQIPLQPINQWTSKCVDFCHLANMSD